MESPFDTWFNGLPRKEKANMLSPKIDMQISFNAGAEKAKSKCDLCKAAMQLEAINTIFFMGAASRKEALQELGLMEEKYAVLAEDEGLLMLAEAIREGKP